jgi:hypothetical protein
MEDMRLLAHEDGRARAGDTVETMPRKHPGVTPLAFIVMGVVAATALLTSQRDAAPGAETLRASEVESDITLYKRTFLSLGALADGEFLSRNLGLTYSYSHHYTMKGEKSANTDDAHSDSCANRMILNGLGAWELHFFESFVTPEGNVSVGDWIMSWNALHDEIVRNGLGEWDVFAAQMVTFYTPYLGPFIKKLTKEGTPFFATRYAHPGTADGTIMYSLWVSVPNAGVLVELTSDDAGLTASQLRAFANLTAHDEVCPASLYARQTPSELKTRWSNMLGRVANDNGLPDVMPVSTTHPATEVDGVYEFFKDYTTAGADLATYSISGDGCDVRGVELAYEGTQDNAFAVAPIFVKTVDNRRAVQGLGGLTLAAFEEYVASVHAEYTGCQSGWDRYFDHHLGVMVDSSLDFAASGMCGRAVGFHAHPDADDADYGSLWSAGTGKGLGVELQGAIDHSYFNASQMHSMNYCSPTTEGRCFAGSGCSNDDDMDDATLSTSIIGPSSSSSSASSADDDTTSTHSSVSRGSSVSSDGASVTSRAATH